MRKNIVIITIDYETWQPIPKGYKIEWLVDLIENTNSLMNICESNNAKLTLMVEMGEYWWLVKNEPKIASLVENQLQDAISRGHDVQLHMHPNWLPETGVFHENGKWEWNWDFASTEYYPFDLDELFLRCVKRLEKLLISVKKDYKVIAYRAGAYRVQPFIKTYQSLLKNEILCDTSVFRGGKSKSRGYNFSKCKSPNMPYFLNKVDPQLRETKREEQKIVELPISTWKKGQRWFLDNQEEKVFARRFIYFPKNMFENENNFFVLIGHSKGNHNYEDISEQLKILYEYPDVCFSTISAEFKKILFSAKFPQKAKHDIKEIEKIMEMIYTEIEPENIGGRYEPHLVLREKKALCYGYAMLLMQILTQYGYSVTSITLFAQNMPNGRGRKKVDTHEVLELILENKRYILDPTTNTIIPFGIKAVLKNPSLATKKKYPDSRYIYREYKHYDTCYLYERVKYYKRKKNIVYEAPNETILEKFIRCLKNLFFNYIMNLIKFRNL